MEMETWGEGEEEGKNEEKDEEDEEVGKYANNLQRIVGIMCKTEEHYYASKLRWIVNNLCKKLMFVRCSQEIKTAIISQLAEEYKEEWVEEVEEVKEYKQTWRRLHVPIEVRCRERYEELVSNEQSRPDVLVGPHLLRVLFSQLEDIRAQLAKNPEDYNKEFESYEQWRARSWTRSREEYKKKEQRREAYNKELAVLVFDRGPHGGELIEQEQRREAAARAVLFE